MTKDNERMNRKFCEAYGHLPASIACTMAKFGEVGCVLTICLKGGDFEETTRANSRGSVEGTKCGNSATFWTFLQQWFSLGTMKDIMNKAKECESLPSNSAMQTSQEQKKKIRMKGRKDRAIALIAGTITQAADKVKQIMQKAAAEEDALAVSLDTADRATETLLKSIKIMQQSLAAAVTLERQS